VSLGSTGWFERDVAEILDAELAQLDNQQKLAKAGCYIRVGPESDERRDWPHTPGTHRHKLARPSRP
jgi:hypothetical protein